MLDRLDREEWKEFVEAVIRQLPRDIDPVAAEGWIGNQDKLKKALREALSPNNPPRNVYPVIVNYGRSVEEMVEAGQYSYSSDAITSENFPTQQVGSKKVPIELVRFDWDKGLVELDRMGFRPADLRELLALGEKYPEIQHRFSVVALGSVWRDSRGCYYVPYLGKGSSRRVLDLGWIGHSWSDMCRLAAVRK